MGIFRNKKEEEKKATDKPEAKVEVAAKSSEKKAPATDKNSKPVVKDKPVVKEKTVKEKKVVKKSAGKISGTTDQAHRILIKPLITEKATDLGGLNKYVFEVASSMNKVEVKKAIRAVYNVDPVRINMLNFSGKTVRFGRIKGKRRGWKKAVVTLKKGDKIEVYEGV